MKRNIRAFWLEGLSNGMTRIYVLRDRRPNDNKIPLYSYSPSPASLKRVKKVAKVVTRSAFALYECEPIDDDSVLVGWVLRRLNEAVYPPPMGTLNGGQEAPLVPSEAIFS